MLACYEGLDQFRSSSFEFSSNHYSRMIIRMLWTNLATQLLQFQATFYSKRDKACNNSYLCTRRTTLPWPRPFDSFLCSILIQALKLLWYAIKSFFVFWTKRIFISNIFSFISWIGTICRICFKCLKWMYFFKLGHAENAMSWSLVGGKYHSFDDEIVLDLDFCDTWVIGVVMRFWKLIGLDDKKYMSAGILILKTCTDRLSCLCNFTWHVSWW